MQENMDHLRNNSDVVINSNKTSTDNNNFKNNETEVDVLTCNVNDNNNVSDKPDKVLSNRTSHTRFFQRLYGHLEDDVKNPSKEEKIKINDDIILKKRSQILVSPSESSELSSSSPEIMTSDQKNQRNFQNFPQNVVNYDIGLPHFPSTILPSHFGSIRPLIGLSPADANHHFAAFCEY